MACLSPRFLLSPLGVALAFCLPQSMAVPFTVPQEAPLPLVCPKEAGAASGESLEQLLARTNQVQNRYVQENPSVEAIRFLHEGLRRMGKHGLTLAPAATAGGPRMQLTTLRNAPPELREDPAIQQALRAEGPEADAAREAYYVRTGPGGILIVANTVDGFNHAVADLLEQAGYAVLGVGPNWTHVPDLAGRPLVFDTERAGRPGFFIRNLALSSGQGHGLGTLFKRKLPDPADEPVEASFNRWTIGTHIIGQSIPRFLGHQFQRYHAEVARRMRAEGLDEGFLARPGTLPTPREGKFYPAGADAKARSLKLDLSTPLVREVLLAAFKEQSEAHFAEGKEGLFLFGTEPEDGIVAEDTRWLRHPNWYPDYLRQRGLPFGQPYRLHGVLGLEQPHETWEPGSLSDTVFAFNNWLLWEYDRWLDSRPPEERLAADGQPKKARVRTSLYSYNTHDVPPNFNLDPRIRVAVAGFPKHRGLGKWRRFATPVDMGRAFRALLPDAPLGDYWIISIASHRDFGPGGISGSRLPESIHRRVRETYEAGFRSVSAECDLNFGRYGLEYYLYAQMLWNPRLTLAELTALRDTWLQRAYGSGWEPMRTYHELLAPESGHIKAPNTWARAIALIDEADGKIDRQREPDAGRRLDDLKQFWYFHYLCESGQGGADSAAMREFVWKGQMSYMTSMNMVAQRIFKTAKVNEIVPPALREGPAHYTAKETAAWWARVREFWRWTPVAEFRNATLANGRPAAGVDLWDLVSVAEFGPAQTPEPFLYQSATQQNAAFLTTATREGEAVGFRMAWPRREGNLFAAKALNYGISRWVAAEARWEDLVDETMAAALSKEAAGADGKPYHEVEVRFAAPAPGTYRLSLSYGGNEARLSGPAYLPGATGDAALPPGVAGGVTFFGALTGLAQGPVYLYLPKGTRSFDVETWGPGSQRRATFHTGLPGSGMQATRTVELAQKGTCVIPLQAGEDGSLVKLESAGFAMPYTYSVPLLWARSPGALLLPRAIAEADGLSPLP